MSDTTFELGEVVMTQGVKRWVEDGLDPIRHLRRHARGDWGNVSDEDARRNDEAVDKGLRILSSYDTDHGELWIITEAGRHATTLLTPNEY